MRIAGRTCGCIPTRGWWLAWTARCATTWAIPTLGASRGLSALPIRNNFDGATTTILYNIDARQDVLVIQNPPNAGGLVTVGSLGMNVSTVLGFDILTMGGRDIGYVAMIDVDRGDFRSWFGTINLNTGMIMPIAPIGGVALRVRDIAVVPEPASMLALSAGLTALAALRRRKR
jgi:hypothetical protein